MFMKTEEGRGNTKLNTIIGPGSYVEGNLNIRGGLRIDGSVKGNEIIAKGPLTVGQEAGIEAPVIKAASATIGGTIEGDVTALEMIRLEPTARIKGNLVTKALIVEEGARFTGNSNMSETEKDKG